MKLRSENGESQGDSNLRELGSHHLESRSHHICALTCLSSFQSNSYLCSPLLLSPPANSPVIARPSLSAAFHGKATPSSPGWSRALSPGDPESAGGRGHPSITGSFCHVGLSMPHHGPACSPPLTLGLWNKSCVWLVLVSPPLARGHTSGNWQRGSLSSLGGENYLFHQPYSHQGAACPGGSPAQRPRRRGWERLQCWGWQAWRPSGWCSDPACICLSAPHTCAVPHLSPSRLGRPGSRSSGLWLKGQGRCRWRQAGEARLLPPTVHCRHRATSLPVLTALRGTRSKLLPPFLQNKEEKTEAPRAKAMRPGSHWSGVKAQSRTSQPGRFCQGTR